MIFMFVLGFFVIVIVFVIEIIRTRLGLAQNEARYHDLDEFFGTWNRAEYKKMLDVLRSQRRIDPELWK